MEANPSPPRATWRSFKAAVAEGEDGLETGQVCRRRWPTYSEGDWQALFGQGGLLLNGRPAAPETRVQRGDMLECTVPVGPEPEARTDYRILFCDTAIAVVDKPGNLPCHPAGRYYANTLEQLLREREGWGRVHLVNRLDRETSGLVLAALTPAAAARLGAAFMHREVRKTYLALVEGVFPEAPRTVSGWLYLARGTTVRRKRVFVPEGTPHPEKSQPVETAFRRTACHEGMSWLEVTPTTGRPHQIRATLKALNFPIVGDKLYGLDETIYARLSTDGITALDRRRLRIDRQALHACRLRFPHPETGEPLDFEAPLPDDLRRFWPADAQ